MGRKNNGKGIVSIYMMTTFSGESFKAPQMPGILSELSNRGLLGNCFGIHSNTDKSKYQEDVIAKLNTSYLIKILFKICSIICRKFHLDAYYYYERIYGVFALFHKAEGDIILLKPRPAFLIKWFKQKGKIVIVEASENHTRFTYDQILKECNFEGIPLIKSNYTDKKCIEDYAKGVTLADRIICLSNFSANTYKSFGIKNELLKIVHLYTGCVITKPTYSEKDLVFTTVANHGFLKGTHKIIDVWNRYKIPYKLYVIGNIYDDTKTLLLNQPSNSNIKYVGSWSRDKINHFYAENRCVNILASMSESFGRSVYEALCSSVPVVVTRTCTCDIVTHQYNGFIIDGSRNSINEAVRFFASLSPKDFFEFQTHVYESIDQKDYDFNKEYVNALN